MILVFGTTGQVATELRSLAPRTVFLSRAEADLTEPDACAAAIRKQAPTVVINATAYTAVDKAEDDEAIAMQVNAALPTAMARVCAALAIPLVHLSTDYVFDGASTPPFAPDHLTAPLGVHGRSKLLGEHGVRTLGGAHVILRTSWVFSAHGSNFVKTMLRLGATRDTLTVVLDRVVGSTPACAIAQACLSNCRPSDAGPHQKRYLSLCRSPGHQLGGFRARDLCLDQGQDNRHRHSRTGLSHARRAPGQQPAGLRHIGRDLRHFAAPLGRRPRGCSEKLEITR